MLGNRFRINIFLGLFVLSLLLPALANADGGVAMLLSDEEHAYLQPLPHLEAALGIELPVYNLYGDIENAPRIMAEILAHNPKLIIAFGAKAAYVAKTWCRGLPNLQVLFAMVLNWKRYDLLDSPNVIGIAAEASPGTQLANLSMLSPRLKRIGIIYSAEFTADFVKEAKAAAEILGLQIIAQEIKETRDFKLAYKKMVAKVDGFWLLADPLIYSLENVAWLKDQCIKDRLICIGQSSNIAKAGILLAVDPDPASIGVQAASLARSILNGNRTSEQTGVMQPLGTKVILNMRTAREIGLSIDPRRRDFVDTVIDH